MGMGLFGWGGFEISWNGSVVMVAQLGEYTKNDYCIL